MLVLALWLIKHVHKTEQTHIRSILILFKDNLKSTIYKQLSSSENLLFLQKTWAWFPAFTGRLTIFAIISVFRKYDALLWSPEGLHAHDALTTGKTHTKWSNKLIKKSTRVQRLWNHLRHISLFSEFKNL